MNSVEAPATMFEWKIKFPDGVIWTVVETGTIFAVESSGLIGDLGCKGMNTLTFLRRALHSGGSVLPVRDIGPM